MLNDILPIKTRTTLARRPAGSRFLKYGWETVIQGHFCWLQAGFRNPREQTALLRMEGGYARDELNSIQARNVLTCTKQRTT